MRGYVTDPSAPRGLRLADDLPRPQPAPHEAVVEVRACSVNRGELLLLDLRADGWRPGQDVAGVVHRAAADGSGPAEGSPVVAVVDGAGWSQQVAVPTHHLARLDPAVAYDQAATLPIAGLTALRALRQGGALLGRDVLVTGATGGVGQFAVQLAKAGGARVTAHVSGPHREAEARDLGADEVVWDLDGAGPFHLALDGVGGQVLSAAVSSAVPGGTVVAYGGVAGAAEVGLATFRPAPLVRIVGFFHHVPEAEKGADLATLAGFVADGRVRPRLGAVADWTELRDLLDRLEDREIRGKAVVTVGD